MSDHAASACALCAHMHLRRIVPAPCRDALHISCRAIQHPRRLACRLDDFLCVTEQYGGRLCVDVQPRESLKRFAFALSWSLEDEHPVVAAVPRRHRRPQRVYFLPEVRVRILASASSRRTTCRTRGECRRRAARTCADRRTGSTHAHMMAGAAAAEKRARSYLPSVLGSRSRVHILRK